MSDAAVAGAAAAGTAEANKADGANAGVKFAGKYDTPEAFEKGLREGAKAAGMPISDKAKVYGEGGMFANVKEAEEGYKAIERAITAKNKPEPKTPAAPMPGDKVEPESQIDEDADLETVLTKAGLSPSEIGLTFMNDGKLKDDQYAAIRKALPGATKKMIDTVMATQIQLGKAEWDNATTAAATIAGGREKLTELVQWASKNMDPGIVKGLSDQAKANPKFYPTMIELFASQYAKNAGGKPGGSGVAPTVGKPQDSTRITTAAEFKKLRQAVERGEPGARERMAAADLSSFLGGV